MNVLGKIKSKKILGDEKDKKVTADPAILTQQRQTQGQILQRREAHNIVLTKSSKVRGSNEFIYNSNATRKQEQQQSKRKDSFLTATSNSIANNLTYFSKRNQKKKPGVYFEENHKLRKNFSSNHPHSNNSSKSDLQHQNQSQQENQSENSLNFGFLLSNNEKRYAKKSIAMNKGKMENLKSIQQQLLVGNQEVLCLIVKKWHSYGDVYMFQGEIQSLKKRVIEVDFYQKPYKVYDRMRIKLSCSKNIIVAPQSIGRFYLKGLIFLSQNEAMIDHSLILRVIEKNLRFKNK